MANTKICHRSFTIITQSSALTGKTGGSLANSQCLGPACMLWVQGAEDPSVGACGDLVQAIALSRIAEEIADLNADPDEAPTIEGKN